MQGVTGEVGAGAIARVPSWLASLGRARIRRARGAGDAEFIQASDGLTGCEPEKTQRGSQVSRDEDEVIVGSHRNLHGGAQGGGTVPRFAP